MSDYITEVVTLPEGGKVTGKVTVTWLSGGRATANASGDGSGLVHFRGADYGVRYARFHLADDGSWTFQPENMMVPVRKGDSAFSAPAARTHQAAVLDAIAEALKAAYTPKVGQAAGRARAQQDIERAERKIAELNKQLDAAREELTSARARLHLYTD